MEMGTKKTLYAHLVSSHLRIAAIGGAFLFACFLLMLTFQRGASVVANVRLPAALASATIERGVESSISDLRSNIMLGRSESPADENHWEKSILPGVEQLAVLELDDQSLLTTLKFQLANLRDAQWYVHEMAGSVGNYPARLIYEQDLLPIYDRIHRAIGGVDDAASVSSIRLSAALTHQQLSEAVRQLSEAVRTGSLAKVQDFRDGSVQVQNHLRQLALQVSDQHDSKPLLDWIQREYAVYEELANQTIRVRRSPQWNQALNLMRSDIEPLLKDIKATLLQLRSSHNASLLSDVSSNEQFTRIGGIANLLMVVGLLLLAWRMAKSRALWVAEPLETLSGSAEAVFDNPDRDLSIPNAGPIEVRDLAHRFRRMSKQLIQRSKELMNANVELQEYTHIVTHDLKPPLINIKGHASLIAQQLGLLEELAKDTGITDSELRKQLLAALESEVPESMSYIDLSISQANTLIGGIQNNSKLLFRDVVDEEVDVALVVDRVLALFSYQLVDVEFSVSPLPIIRSDPMLVEHIFTNLIDNAIKYLDKRRPGSIDISHRPSETAMQFSVCDNGIGVESSDADIFRMFQRGAVDEPGSGIGLALTATMVAKLGGDIDFFLNDDVGTTFRFELPLVPDRESKLPSEAIR